MMKVTVVGDALLDRDLVGTASRLAPDAPVPVVDTPDDRPRPGGAALAAVLAAADGADVTLVTALGADGGGATLRRLLAAAGVTVVDLGLRGATPEKVRVRVAGQSLVRLDYGAPGSEVGPLPAEGRRAVDGADALLVSDYGRGLTGEPSVRSAVARATAACPVVWDPHPRGTDPVPGVRLATPNADEARRATGLQGDDLPAVVGLGRALVERWRAAGVVVTLGARGAVLVGADGTPVAVPAPALAVGDPCGAGDRFAATTTTRLAAGALPSEAVPAAVAAASAFVAAGGAATWPHRAPAPSGEGDPAQVIAAVRSRGGTVVATGGCFDLLHAGHVRMLAAARALGDCLVVCLNSDASVRRLKGPDRPLVPAADRAAVLSGLACVDAVAVFEEDTPEAIIARLRPDVWAKGGDYAVEDLPEAALLRSWGGQAVILPYLAGRSTSLLLQEAVTRARG